MGVALLTIGVSSAFIVNSFGENGDAVRVDVNGKMYGEYSLSKDQVIDIKNDVGHINRLEIKDGSARMIFAECPDQYCLRDPAISKSNESIVCLPNQVIISTPKSADGQVDVVVQ